MWLAKVMQAAKEYVDVTGRRVSFEWTLIAGENVLALGSSSERCPLQDTPEKAQELGKLIYLNCPGADFQGLLCGSGAHVNLIPLNPTNGYAGGPSQREAHSANRCGSHDMRLPLEAVARFVETLRQFGVEAG